jgi:hypothetical protein
MQMHEAKLKELAGLEARGVFQIISRSDVPQDANVLSTRFVLTVKNPGDKEESCKARLVVRGFQDDLKNFLVHQPNTARAVSLRVLLSLSAALSFRIWTEDVTQAFVQSTGCLERDVFVVPPAELGLADDYLLKLLKPLYGLSDAGDYWSRTMYEHHAKALKMTPSVNDNSFFFKRGNAGLTGLALVHVDDSLRAGDSEFIEEARVTAKTFDSKRNAEMVLGFCGITLMLSPLQLSQAAYISKLNKLADNADFAAFRSTRAKLAWCLNTRPDISIDVANMASITSTTFSENASAIIRGVNSSIDDLLRTKDLMLRYPRLDVKSMTLHTFADAAFPANETDHRCQIAYIIFLADESHTCCVVDFRSVKAQRVSRSVLGGELIALAEAFDRSFILKHDIEDMLGIQVPLKLYTDSQSLFDVITKGSMTSERRLMIDIALAQEAFKRHWISNIGLVPSEHNLADGLTKPGRSELLRDVIRQGRLDIHVRQWIVRSAT